MVFGVSWIRPLVALTIATGSAQGRSPLERFSEASILAGAGDLVRAPKGLLKGIYRV